MTKSRKLLQKEQKYSLQFFNCNELLRDVYFKF